MPWERIGECGGSRADPAWIDFSHRTAIRYLKLALGDPPEGCDLDIMWCDHELGSYARVGLWYDFPVLDAPWEYINRAEQLLDELNAAVDWDKLSLLIDETFERDDEDDEGVDNDSDEPDPVTDTGPVHEARRPESHESASTPIVLVPVPDKFPPGCQFFEMDAGERLAVFADGKLFALSEDGSSLLPRAALPELAPLDPITKSAFIAAATARRSIAACQVARQSAIEAQPRPGRIPLPDQFPEGSRFAMSFGGDEFVEFPDGKVFKLSDDGASLLPAGRMPDKSAVSIDADRFFSLAASYRAAAAKDGGSK
jgi:hypothetical protein